MFKHSYQKISSFLVCIFYFLGISIKFSIKKRLEKFISVTSDLNIIVSVVAALFVNRVECRSSCRISEFLLYCLLRFDIWYELKNYNTQSFGSFFEMLSTF